LVSPPPPPPPSTPSPPPPPPPPHCAIVAVQRPVVRSVIATSTLRFPVYDERP
jgi:hypothetical protein